VIGPLEVGAMWVSESPRPEGDAFAAVAWDDGVKRAPVPVARLMKDEGRAL